MSSSQTHADLIVSGDHLLPGWRQKEVIRNGAVAIRDDAIIAVGTRDELLQQYNGAKEIHEPHGLIMPGLINTHTHAPMACFRGFADDLPLMTWLQEHIFPVEARLTPEIVHDSTLLSIAEMIKSGTTSFCDMYLFAGYVAEATAKTGIRGWLGEVLYDFPSPSYGELENGYAYVKKMLEEYRNHPLISVTVDPHSIYTCAPELLAKCGELAEEYDARYVVHLSETQTEVDTCLERYQRTPVRHLDKLNLLNQRTLAAHCVVLDDEEISILAERGVKVSHCIESNMKLSSGIAPVPKLIDYGVTVSLGTDGSASNNDVDLFAEMSSVAKVHKAVMMDPTVMSAETTLKAATVGGAEALGVESAIGSLEPGKKADLIVLDLDQPHLTPLYNIPSHLVYAARGDDVIHSVINGRVVMENRTLLTVDERAVIGRMKEIGKEIIAFKKAK